jgi:glycosyltransferase involved in cell wall biosynthesis
MVSICIPTYNNLKLFQRCLSSVQQQDFTDYEIIVSDDSTNDEIEKYLLTIELKNIKYTRNTPSLGSPLNWNKAMEMASGDYIKILHHDDYFSDKNSLSKFVNAFTKNPEVAFVFSETLIAFKKQNLFFVNKANNSQLRRLSNEPEFLFFRNIIGAPSVTMFRKDKNLVFDSKYKWLVDVAFYIKYLKKYPKYLCIRESLVTVVDGETDQITQSIATDKEYVITENLQLFAGIYSEKLNNNKARLFFEELFLKFHIGSYSELEKGFQIPEIIRPFLNSVFVGLPRHRFFKSIKKRLLTSRYNKLIFKIERF